MALLPGSLIFKSGGPLSIAVYSMSDVVTGDTFNAAGEFSHVKNAIFYPLTIDNWIDSNMELPLVTGSLTVVTFNTPNLDHESGWLVIIGGA